MYRIDQSATVYVAGLQPFVAYLSLMQQIPKGKVRQQGGTLRNT